MSKSKKLYGVIEEFRENDTTLFARLKDLNDKSKEDVFHIFISNNGKDNKFGTKDQELKKGQRIAFTGTSVPFKDGFVFKVDSDVTVYAEKPKAKGRDNTGMEIGHALNAAYALTNYKKTTKDSEIVELAKAIHDITVNLKKERSEATGIPVDNYDLGASVGHAILNACRIRDKIEEVEQKAKDILDGPVVEVTKYVRGE